MPPSITLCNFKGASENFHAQTVYQGDRELSEEFEAPSHAEPASIHIHESSSAIFLELLHARTTIARVFTSNVTPKESKLRGNDDHISVEYLSSNQLRAVTN